MKKFLPLIICICFFSGFAKAQYVTIPDDNFRLTLQSIYPSCFNSEGLMDTTCSAILNAVRLGIGDQRSNSNFEGLQYFKALKYLEVSILYEGAILPALPNIIDTLIFSAGFYIKTLPTLPASLVYLDCSNNSGLTSIPTLPASLKYLNCRADRSLTSLPDLPASLTYLDCRMNGSLTNLPALPASLTYLNCENSSLTSIPDLPSSLTYLNCSGNLGISHIPNLPASLIYLNCGGFVFSQPGPPIIMPPLPASLAYLECGSSNISSLPSLPASLTFLSCSLNQLTVLPTLPAALAYLDCSYNQLPGLPTLPAALNYLNCSSDQLPDLPALPASLARLDCYGNKLSGLPTLPPSLNHLNCGYNRISSLPALPDKLAYLDCSHNQLLSLPALQDSLAILNCSFNQLGSLPSLPASLSQLLCSTNQLTSLPVLPPVIDSLDCSSNQLSSLPALPPNLYYMDCSKNNIYCLPLLPVVPETILNRSYIVLDRSKIQCTPNAIKGDFFTPDTSDDARPDFVTLPLCNPTNNVNHCVEFPVMAGNIFYDNNSNGIKDAGELYHPYIKMQLSNGTSTFTNNNGYYEIGAYDGLGTYTLSAYAPTYYKAVPVLMNYTFTNFDTLVTQNIALQPTAFVDSLDLSVYSVHRNARPGFDFPVAINYANVGTTTLSPTIVFNYDNTRLTYDSSSNHNVVNNGSSLSLAEGSFVPGQSNSFIAYFTTKTTNIIGDSIKTSASITANTFTAKDSIENLISGSFDPNDKEGTPQLTPKQVAKGKSIQYTIRFQNTGTDTAFNIVIADTLSSLLQANSLQMISSAKPCKVTVTGNVVFFEFLNVLLPDNKTNDIGSNGYVSFSVQPQNNLSSGSIPNTAFIYFDYNTPIVTNTASTLIQDFTVPLKLLSFTALMQPNTINALLSWNTASQVNTKSFVIEQSTDGITFSSVATVAAKGLGNHSYSYSVAQNAVIVYYRLRIIDNNGQYSYSPVVKLKALQSGKGFIVLNNPVKNSINIKTEDALLNNTTASILNNDGVVIKRFVLHTGNQSIDVNDLPAGGYYLQTQSSSLKIVISK